MCDGRQQWERFATWECSLYQTTKDSCMIAVGCVGVKKYCAYGTWMTDFGCYEASRFVCFLRHFCISKLDISNWEFPSHNSDLGPFHSSCAGLYTLMRTSVTLHKYIIWAGWPAHASWNAHGSLLMIGSLLCGIPEPVNSSSTTFKNTLPTRPANF